MNKLRRIGIFRLGPTMKSTLVNDLPEDKDTKVVLEEPTKKNVLLEK
jgi:hypothetical protein